MEKRTSKPVLETRYHKKTQSGGDQNEAESKQLPQPERVLLVDKPYQSKKKVKPVEKIKEPKRGLGVAKLEILRLEGKLMQMTEQLEQLQAEKEITAAAGAPSLPLLLPRPQPQHHHHHQQQQHQQFQVPFPPFVDPRQQQYPNGMIPVPYGRFVPVAGAMNKDGPHPHPHPHPHHTSFVFQPMNKNGGYPGEPMNVIPNGGFPTGNGGGFIPAGHHEPNINMNGNGGFPTGNGGGYIPAGHHEPNINMNGNGGGSPAGHGHHHEPNINMNGNGGGSPAGHGHHHEPNINMNGNGGGSPAGHHHLEPNNNMNGNGGGFPGGEVNNGGYSNQNIAGNPFMYLDQQLRVQHLKLMHSARELCAIQRMQYHHQPRRSKFDVQMDPNINIEQEPKSKDKMVMNDSLDDLELSLRSTTNIDEKIQKDDDEEVEEVDAFGVGRRSTSSSAIMEYEFFPRESSDNRSSSYSGGGGGMGGSSEASTSNENAHLLDLSLKLSL